MNNYLIDSKVNILGVGVFSGSRSRVLKLLRDAVTKKELKKPIVVFTPTTEQVVMAVEDRRFCTTLNGSDINLPDSVGLVAADWWLSRKKGRKWQIRERLPGVEIAEELVRTALNEGGKVFLVGGKSAAKASEKFKVQSVKFTNLINWDKGARDIKQETEAERARVLKRIANFMPDLVLVAYGAPWQEDWVLANKEVLGKAGVGVVMVVGGALDMWAKITPRAPIWVRKIGLEWLWRLMLEPWRWRRQLRLGKFVGRVLIS